MKIRFLKLKDWLLMSVMGLLGMTACHSAKEVSAQPAEEKDGDEVEVTPRNEMALMYGVPTMDFVLKGRVIDVEGNGVSGMQVVLVSDRVGITPDAMHDDNEAVQAYIRESGDTTDANGYFECHMSDFPKDVQHVIVRDVDGKKNGSYQSQMVEVNFGSAKVDGERKGWYNGKRTLDVDITVKETE